MELFYIENMAINPSKVIMVDRSMDELKGILIVHFEGKEKMMFEFDTKDLLNEAYNNLVMKIELSNGVKSYYGLYLH